jgi:hypothetical protein
MKKVTESIQYHRPALFDWLVFITSFLLGFVFPDLEEFVISPWFSYMMLGGLVFYIAGAILKHVPLRDRLSSPLTPPREIHYALFLVVGHWMIMLVALIFSSRAFNTILGLPSKKEADGIPVGLLMVLAGVLTVIVYRSKKTKTKKKEYGERYLFRRELIADIFLFTGVSVFTFIFWEKGIMALLSYKPATGFSDLWFLFILLSITYVLFYLPLRYLYLLEDRSHQQTWKRMLFIFGFLLLRSLFEILKF